MVSASVSLMSCLKMSKFPFRSDCEENRPAVSGPIPDRVIAFYHVRRLGFFMALPPGSASAT